MGECAFCKKWSIIRCCRRCSTYNKTCNTLSPYNIRIIIDKYMYVVVVVVLSIFLFFYNKFYFYRGMGGGVGVGYLQHLLQPTTSA